MYSALKEDRGWGVKADLNQELNVEVNFVDVQWATPCVRSCKILVESELLQSPGLKFSMLAFN